ncbi:hypothetical protein ACFE04_011051 [Oxalis oulophora]
MEMEQKQQKQKHSTEDDEPIIINYRGIKAMPFIIGNETFEKLGTVGSSTNLVVYLTTVFNMKSVTAATYINIFNGTTNFAPLLGAFLSDTYFGRYKTLGFASVSSVLGMTMLMLTAAITTLHPQKCESNNSDNCPGPSPWQLTFLLASFGLLVIGAGGIRPCNLAFGADQFNPTTKSGRRGTTSFFNWYYFTYTFAVMVSVTIIVYVQSDVSWAIGLGVPAFFMLLSTALFFWGTYMYVIVKPQGSPLTSVAQVLVASMKKRKLKIPENAELSLFKYIRSGSINSQLPYTEQLRCLDKAAIFTTEDKLNLDGSTTKEWELCSVQQVEEVKCVIRVIPIWASSIICHIALLQTQTYVVFQALQMDRRLPNTKFEVPAASFVVFVMLTLTIWIPLYDRVLVPLIQKVTGKEGGFTLLQRMGVGMAISIITMVISGLIEEQRRTTALHGSIIGNDQKGGAISSMSAFWLVPQLSLVGLAEAFNYIAQIEFYYKQFPENMRSIAGSFFFCGYALGNYMSGTLVSVVHKITMNDNKSGGWLAEDLNNGKLDYFYYLIGALGVINFVYFQVCAKWYRYKGDGDGIKEMKNGPIKHIV